MTHSQFVKEGRLWLSRTLRAAVVERQRADLAWQPGKRSTEQTWRRAHWVESFGAGGAHPKGCQRDAKRLHATVTALQARISTRKNKIARWPPTRESASSLRRRRACAKRKGAPLRSRARPYVLPHRWLSDLRARTAPHRARESPSLPRAHLLATRATRELNCSRRKPRRGRGFAPRLRAVPLHG